MKTEKEIRERTYELLRNNDQCQNKMRSKDTERRDYMKAVGDYADNMNELRILKWVLDEK